MGFLRAQCAAPRPFGFPPTTQEGRRGEAGNCRVPAGRVPIFSSGALHASGVRLGAQPGRWRPSAEDMRPRDVSQTAVKARAASAGALARSEHRSARRVRSVSVHVGETGEDALARAASFGADRGADVAAAELDALDCELPF